MRIDLAGKSGDAPAGQHSLLNNVARRHEHERRGPVFVVSGFLPGLPEAVQEQPDVEVRQAVTDKQDRAAERIGTKLHIERRVESQPVEVVALGQYK